MIRKEADQATLSPLFSVVIATRNRRRLALDAIHSVLTQTFSDFELIISDNSDLPMAETNASSHSMQWLHDPRVKYVHTTHIMNVADHFDFATRVATGRYVAILTDRFVMIPNCLKTLANLVLKKSADSPNLVVWNVQSSYSDLSGVLTIPAIEGRFQTINSLDLLQSFLSFSSWKDDGAFYFSKLPRGLNSLYRRQLAVEIIDRHGRLFRPLSPDYASAFLFLTYAPEILNVDLPLYVAHGDQSTGARSMIHGLRTFTTDVDPLEGCPLQIDTVFNSVVRDFLAVQRLVNPKLNGFGIDMVGYFLLNYQELIDKERLGSLVNLESAYRLWWEGLSQLPTEQQNTIREELRVFEKMKPTRFNRAKQKMIRRCRLDGARHRIREFQKMILQKVNGGTIYPNVFEAARAVDNRVEMCL